MRSEEMLAPKQKALLSGATLTLVMLVVYLLQLGDPPAEPRIQPAFAENVAAEVKVIQAEAALAELPAPAVRKQVVESKDWINYFYDGNLYASVQAQRQARKPGSFASIIKLIQPCLAYHLNEGRAVLAAPGVANQPNYAERVKAQQQLAARCSSLDQESLWGLLEPLPGDEEGKRFQVAQKRLGVLSREPGLVEAVEEMLRQGNAADVLGRATARHPYWQGQLWEGGPEEYGLALQLAEYQAHSLPGRERDDLRMLADCMAYDICSYNATSTIRKLPPARVGPVLALADQMAEALRQANYGAFVKRP